MTVLGRRGYTRHTNNRHVLSRHAVPSVELSAGSDPLRKTPGVPS